jgi:hypothetical protein
MFSLYFYFTVFSFTVIRDKDLFQWEFSKQGRGVAKWQARLPAARKFFSKKNWEGIKNRETK